MVDLIKSILVWSFSYVNDSWTLDYKLLTWPEFVYYVEFLWYWCKSKKRGNYLFTKAKWTIVS